jgi:hypothetical protein
MNVRTLRGRWGESASTGLTLAVALSLLGIFSRARADTFTLAEARIPDGGRGGLSLAWSGESAYLFGGVGPSASTHQAAIFRYSLADDLVTKMSGSLPSERIYTSAVWDGRYAYVFGGTWEEEIFDEIVRFDPENDTVRLMGAHLSTPRYSTSAVWDGRNRPTAGCRHGCAYIFGGRASPASGEPFDAADVMRYNPDTDTLVTMAAVLPGSARASSAVFDGHDAYIFGGLDTSAGVAYTNLIARYDPLTDTVATMDAHLPRSGGYATAAWDGHNAVIFGGFNGGFFDEVFSYDPSTDTGTILSARLPSARCCGGAFWDGRGRFLAGGLPRAIGEEILRYRPGVPGAPEFLNAAQGVDRIRLSWSPPHNDAREELSGYRIYRAVNNVYNPPGTVFSLVGEVAGDVLQFEDASCRILFACSYQVSAFNEQAEGPRSNTASGLGTAVAV